MLKTPVPAAACAVALWLFPVPAAAQKAAFVEAFVEFHSRLIGTYGDEGPRITAALDEMALRLSEWERTAIAAEAQETAPANLAILLLDRGQYDSAVEALDAAIQAEPQRAPYHRLRGLVLEVLDRPDEAIAALTTAWQIEPADPLTSYLLADRYAARDSGEDVGPMTGSLLAAYEQAGAPPSGRAPRPFIELALIDDRAADVPILSPVLYAEGLALVARGRYGEALAQFRDALKRDPLVVDPAARSEPMARGIAAVREGRLDAAIAQLQTAVMAFPTSSEAHRILGAAYRSGDAARGVEHLSTAVRLRPDDERARVTLGRALADAGRHDEAERTLRETLTKLPASAEARWALADLYEKLGRGLDAAAELQKAASLTVLAGKGPLYWRLADLAHRHQDYELVVEALGRRARLMPNEAGAHKDLALAYTRIGRPEQALVELIVTALLGLEDGETLAAIGQIHLDAGRFDDAVSVLQRAVAQQPDLPQARYALGTALVRLGRAAEGKEHLAEFQRLRMRALEDQRRAFEEGR